MSEILIADPAAAADPSFLAEATALINKVYADGEKGLWVEGTDRTSADEVASIVTAGELAVARRGGQLVGAVRVQRLATGEGEFGMLVADFAQRGTGVGRELVAFAENWGRAQGLTTMQLELLVPQTWTHPVKEFLREWYTRIGYRHVRTGVLAEAYPALQPHLATPCDFLVFHKAL